MPEPSTPQSATAVAHARWRAQRRKNYRHIWAMGCFGYFIALLVSYVSTLAARQQTFTIWCVNDECLATARASFWNLTQIVADDGLANALALGGIVTGLAIAGAAVRHDSGDGALARISNVQWTRHLSQGARVVASCNLMLAIAATLSVAGAWFGSSQHSASPLVLVIIGAIAVAASAISTSLVSHDNDLTSLALMIDDVDDMSLQLGRRMDQRRQRSLRQAAYLTSKRSWTDRFRSWLTQWALPLLPGLVLLLSWVAVGDWSESRNFNGALEWTLVTLRVIGAWLFISVVSFFFVAAAAHLVVDGWVDSWIRDYVRMPLWLFIPFTFTTALLSPLFALLLAMAVFPPSGNGLHDSLAMMAVLLPQMMQVRLLLPRITWREERGYRLRPHPLIEARALTSLQQRVSRSLQAVQEVADYMLKEQMQSDPPGARQPI